jgi:hypothetical protein
MTVIVFLASLWANISRRILEGRFCLDVSHTCFLKSCRPAVSRRLDLTGLMAVDAGRHLGAHLGLSIRALTFVLSAW